MAGGWAALILGLFLFIVGSLALGFLDLDRRAQPAAGDADELLLLPAVDPALGLPVPVPRHAGMGPVARQILPVTHMLRVVRGAMLKGVGIAEALPSLGALDAVRGDCRFCWPSNNTEQPWISVSQLPPPFVIPAK